MYKYFVYYCETCKSKFESMKDDKKENIEQELCECGTLCNRTPYATIAKLEIQEKTHGPEMAHGKIIQRFTGVDKVREERKLEKDIKKMEKKKDVSGAKEAKKELETKRKQNLANLKKGKL